MNIYVFIRTKRVLNDGSRSGGNLGPQVCAFLSNRSSNTRSLHLTLGIDDDTSVIYYKKCH